MKNVVAVIFIILVLYFAISYIIKQKRDGIKCIGCPDADKCKNSSGKASCYECKRKK